MAGYPPPPLAIVDQRFCFPYPVYLIMKEKLSWKDDMDIMDTAGVRHFRLKEKFISLHNKRQPYDIAGIPVVSILKKLITMHETTYICPGDSFDPGHAYAEVKKTILSFKPNLKVYLRGTSPAADFEVHGSFWERNFTIVNSYGVVVAEVSRAFTVESAFFGKDTYQVLINPGVDIAFITALVVIIEEVIVENSQED